MYKNNEQNLNTNEEFLTAAMIPYIHSVNKLDKLHSEINENTQGDETIENEVVDHGQSKRHTSAEEEPSILYAIGCTTC